MLHETMVGLGLTHLRNDLDETIIHYEYCRILEAYDTQAGQLAIGAYVREAQLLAHPHQALRYHLPELPGPRGKPMLTHEETLDCIDKVQKMVAGLSTQWRQENRGEYTPKEVKQSMARGGEPRQRMQSSGGSDGVEVQPGGATRKRFRRVIESSDSDTGEPKGAQRGAGEPKEVKQSMDRIPPF